MSKKDSKKEKKSCKKVIIILSCLIGLIIAFMVFWYVYGLGAVSNKKEEVKFVVKKGESKIKVVDNLKDADLIKSEFSIYIYIILHGNLNLQAGEYMLDRSMTASEIINKISSGEIIDDREYINLKFIEGMRLVDYAKYISENTSYSEEEVMNVVTSEEFLNQVIENYWFVTEDILNKDIYYALEGYLFPSTYEFYSDSSIESIFNRLLSEMGKMLEPYKDELTARNISVHDALSMASIIENEAMTKEDRRMVSQVIYSRLAINMPLGMDSTTSYSVHKDLKQGLTTVDLNSNNSYNTRNNSFIGLPAGPICSPSKVSIDAVFNPTDTDYLYFFANLKTGKVYYAHTLQEHRKNINEHSN